MPRKALNAGGLLLGLGTLAILAACSGGGHDLPPAPGEELRSDLARITTPGAVPADVEAQVAGNLAFALDVYQGLADGAGGGNLFFSPFSMTQALAMTWAGAAGQTETDMAAALRFVLPQERLHPVMNHLDLALASRGQGAQGQDGEGFRLRVVNSLWGQVGFAFQADFLDALALHYGAGLRLLDFVADAAGAAEVINAWVEEATEGRIQDLIPPEALSEYTKLVLTNAIYFNAAWNQPFEEADTADGDFHLLDGTSARVPLMHQTFQFQGAEGPGYQAVALPYDGEELDMVLVVPDAGTFETFEATLDGEELGAILGGLSEYTVELAMPRWTFATETFSIKALLSALGMEVAFSPAADFSGMNPEHALMIHDVLHQAFVSVNEAGTEAAAATAVIVGDTSAPPFMALSLDRPFVYLIRDLPTGAILFLGRVTDPR
ncbi:MAG TPA: serpin family protein [Myxococcota bacterium]|nr:serpin family protein [Myxococcota bacterium]HRY93733.1 serpin family protein [Myxococcota bacterium]